LAVGELDELDRLQDLLTPDVHCHVKHPLRLGSVYNLGLKGAALDARGTVTVIEAAVPVSIVAGVVVVLELGVRDVLSGRGLHGIPGPLGVNICGGGRLATILFQPHANEGIAKSLAWRLTEEGLNALLPLWGRVG
jgi:hypothetical protein